MAVLLAVILVSQVLAAEQTPRELEQQLQRHDTEVKKEFAAMDDNRGKAVEEIKGEFTDMREDLKPPIDAVVAELRRLNSNLESQDQSIARVLDMVSDFLLPLVVALFLGSKTPLGKRLLNGRKHE